MTTIQIIWLSLLQGITEFLPISSSGHLILFSKFTQFPDQGNATDVVLHFGSVLAIIIYFAPDIWKMLCGLWKNKFLPHFEDEGNKLFYLLVIGTIPALLAGLCIKIYGTEILRNTKLIGWNLIVFGILLWVFDHYSLTVMKIKNMGIKDALLIGFAQCFALFPGTSRSGATVTMGRMLGLERREAAKFSMLLAIPVIIIAGFVTLYEIYKGGNLAQLKDALSGVGYSFIFSIGAIYLLMVWLKKWSFLPFVIYRIVLGTVLLLDAYGIYEIRF